MGVGVCRGVGGLSELDGQRGVERVMPAVEQRHVNGEPEERHQHDRPEEKHERDQSSYIAIYRPLNR